MFGIRVILCRVGYWMVKLSRCRRFLRGDRLSFGAEGLALWVRSISGCGSNANVTLVEQEAVGKLRLSNGVFCSKLDRVRL